MIHAKLMHDGLSTLLFFPYFMGAKITKAEH